MHRSVDVADIAATRAFAAEAVAALGPIDILFNNAGMNIRKPFADYSEAEFDRIVGVHLKGMFFMAQAVFPAMVARGSGLHHQRGVAAGAEGGGQLGPVFGGEGRHYRADPSTVVGGGAEGGAGECDRAGADRYRPDGDDGAG